MLAPLCRVLVGKKRKSTWKSWRVGGKKGPMHPVEGRQWTEEEKLRVYLSPFELGGLEGLEREGPVARGKWWEELSACTRDRSG